MVKEIRKDNKTFYVCEACDLAYKEKKWAEQCQQWCQEQQSCNLEIIQHAVPIEADEPESIE